MEGRRRVTLYDQMTAGDTSRRESLAALIFNDVVLANQKSEAEAESRSRTLSDIIREDGHNNTKDRKSWKAFRDKLWFKRAWTNSTVHIPASDIAIRTHTQNNNAETHQQQNDVVDEDTENPAPISREQFSSRTADAPFDGGDSDDEDNNPETRRAVAAETAAAAAGGPVSMSLMDLLEETDREMGFEGSRYRMSDGDDDDEDEEEGVDEFEGGEEEKKGGEEGGVVEHNNCCVCMVRHKGAAFIPCGHTFCRMCCRELWVSRGNCPLCNNFILEILDIF